MDGPTILINEPQRGPKRPAPTPAPDFGWTLLGVAGLAFFLAGLADISLAWIPLHVGNAEWEFGVVSRSLDSLPLPLLGISLVLAAGVARGKKFWSWAAVAVLALLALFVVIAAVLYVLDVPLALRSVQQPQVLAGLKKSIFRTGLQAVLYAVATGVLVWMGVNRIRKASSGSQQFLTEGGGQ